MTKNKSIDPYLSFQYKNWENFKGNLYKDLIGTNELQIHRFLFRGQMNINWKLVPSFYRIFKNYSPSAQKILKNRLLNKFIQFCEADPTLKIILDTNKESVKMAFAQHNGLPTLLLDWTQSPYIASFFALEGLMANNENSNEVSIWIIDTFHPIWMNRGKMPLAFTVPSWYNNRMRNQKGWFTYLEPPFECIEDFVASKRNKKGALYKVIIDLKDSYEKALIDLHLMGISHNTLFPDPTGWAKASLFDNLLRFNQVNRIHHL